MTLTPSIKREYIINLGRQGKRMDNREFHEFRNIKLETNVVKKAEGSARIHLGNTQVMVGIKMDVGEPYPDTPDSGVLTTAAELIPMASPDFEAGPPREEAIELARVVDRGVRESEVVDVEKLCIEPGEKVWILFIDIHILDYDGNLFDAASLATLAALYSTTVPAERFELGDDYPLPLREPPISCTSIKMDDIIIFDPSLDEELIADARLTVATDVNGDIRAMQKGLNGSYSKEEIQKIIKASVDNGRHLRELFKQTIGGK